MLQLYSFSMITINQHVSFMMYGFFFFWCMGLNYILKTYIRISPINLNKAIILHKHIWIELPF